MKYKDKKFRETLDSFILYYEQRNDYYSIEILKKLQTIAGRDLTVDDIISLVLFIIITYPPLSYDTTEDKDRREREWVYLYLNQFFLINQTDNEISIKKRGYNGN